MPQPDSSRNRAPEMRWNESEHHPWPLDPAAPYGSSPLRPSGMRPKEPRKDGRTGEDKDGNEELLEEQEQRKREHEHDTPSSRRTATERQAAMNQARREFENEDTGEWVATERFTLDDELEDTWPTVPARYLE